MAVLMDQECPRCHGEGKVWASRWGGNDPDVWAVKCEVCDGTGVIEVDISEDMEDDDE
jgi:DnaJ-class molecular chaperone